MTIDISLQDVNFAYNSGPNVLDNINLEIVRGEFVGIVGPNGGGKTTLLKLIIGLLQPDKGKVVITKNRVGYVPQFSTFQNDFPISVAETVLMGRLGTNRAIGGYSKVDKQKMRETLAKLEIEALHNKPIDSLSGGQLQRVMVARALVCEPQILLLDEPTANVDVPAEKNIFDLLKMINKEGITILVVSHDIGFISQYIARVVCVNRELRCHPTSKLTPRLLQELYGMPVRVVRHGH